ncbi:hypothetical protein [Nocardioides sp. ChNu-99]|uniref:hypothetical protein n=1 Tax=Nocardioides sp. ChNu-99 TaxID=2839897 RepID=UPI00240664D2|nr:hypothetical protein [Nocardioides sp. ChNu-99]MDF9718097.1 hypothetical protein [Nocardioides sp. ChNu-99]
MADPIEPGKGAHLSAKEVRELEQYVNTVRERLHLTHWTVWIAADPAEEGVHASVHPTEGRFIAMIYFATDWRDQPEDILRNTITHELLHLVHRDQTDTIRCALQDSGYLPEKAFNLLWRSFALHTEAMVDHLAGVLAPTMPPAPTPSREAHA